MGTGRLSDAAGRRLSCFLSPWPKTSKHGHAKAHIVALDIFTGKKMEDLCPSSHNLDCPNVVKTEYRLLTADFENGEVSLLTESGDTKDDLNLPNFVQIGEPTDEDKKCVKELQELVNKEDDTLITVIVQAACGA